MEISYFAEIHALYTFTTQRGTDGRRGRSLPGPDYEFDDLVLCYCFPRHWRCISTFLMLQFAEKSSEVLGG